MFDLISLSYVPINLFFGIIESNNCFMEIYLVLTFAPVILLNQEDVHC